MKLRVGDSVLVTAGKDKGKKGQVIQVMPENDMVIVEGMNLYTRHVKPMGERAGETVRRERALATAKVAIINDKNQPDRIGYIVTKDGKKERIFKKTGSIITLKKVTKKSAPKAKK